MNIKEAAEIAAKHKPVSHYMRIELGYDKKLVLPYKDGLTLLGALQNAQLIEYGWSNKPDRITQIEAKAITGSPMSVQEYQDLVMANLLGVTADEVKKLREEAIQKEWEEARKETSEPTA
jgi:hypothetical protein